MKFAVGTRVRIVDPTAVVAFVRTPQLWTAGTYIVTSGGQAAREGITHVTPEGIRVAFAVGTENLEAVR